MKHYYKFSINYDDDFAIHSVNQELKKGDVVVLTVGVPLGRSGNTNLLKATVVGEY